MSPDGRWVYIANRNTKGAWAGPAAPASAPGARAAAGSGTPPGNVAVIDRATHEIVALIATPPYAAGLGLATGVSR